MSLRDAELREAIKFIKSCEYKGTAIKVELEAQLNREDSDSGYCESCDGDGYDYCQNCNDGELYNEVTEQYDTCEECGGDYHTTCGDCGGSGEHHSGSNYGDTDDCKRFILQHVSDKARKALIFSIFYYDGSVDSEFTFTLPIDKAPLVVEFVKAFKMLADEIGNGLETSGAGMHMAILNSSNGTYPRGNALNDTCLSNFKKTMTPLIPALYFLASPDWRSRGVGYRNPEVGLGKGSAINYVNGCFEYRVFETCYQRPEAILDNIIVIAKTLRFYSKKQVKLPPAKVGTIGFGCEGEGIERFYYSVKHIQALRYGVAILKPDYKTYATLKKERNFKLTVKRAELVLKKNEASWRQEFNSVKANWERRKQDALTRADIDWRGSGFMSLEAYKEAIEADYKNPSMTRVTSYIKNKRNDFIGRGTKITV